MNTLAKEGYAIIMVSSEMPELIGICDRIMVMCEGRITGTVEGKDMNQEKIMLRHQLIVKLLISMLK